MEGAPSDLSSGDDEPSKDLHSPLSYEHVHAVPHALPTPVVQHRRDDSVLVQTAFNVQTALDVVVDYEGTTIGDVLIGSIPNEPTTVSLPGYGLLTLSQFVPAQPTGSSSNQFTTSTSTGPVVTSSSSSTFALTSTPFPTASMTSNSTIASSVEMRTLISGSNSTASFLNSTVTTTSFSTTSFLTSTTTTSSSSSSSLSSTSSSNVVPGGIGGNGPTVAPTAAPTATPSSGPSGPTTNAGQIAGGVVGGVVGAMLVGLVLFFLARYVRNRQGRGDRLDDAEDGAGTAPASRDGPMTQRSSLVPFAAAINRMRHSQQSSVYTAEPSERGFQRVSGRKLMPVTMSGGDGYSDPLPPARDPALVAPHLSTEFLARGETSNRISHTPTEFGGRDPGIRIPGEQFVTPESSAAAASALHFHRPTVAPSSNSSLRAVPESTRASEMAGPSASSAANAAALRSERMFQSGSPDSFDEHLGGAGRGAGAGAGASTDSPSPDFVIQPGAQRTPIIARRPGDGLGRSRPSQDGSRVSRFSETF